MEHNITRYLEAQKNDYQTAKQEMQNGEKISHWIWYIFPQIQGLGSSATAKFYELKDIQEAKIYLNHFVLGERLLTLIEILVENHCNKSAEEIFGFPDYLKFQSCLTLFQKVIERYPQDLDTNDLFKKALNCFYNNNQDQKTLAILDNQS